MWRFVMERQEVVYRLEGIDPEEGVDVDELVPYLQRFSDLVKRTVRETGYSGDIAVRLKPFREGSFITEFVLGGGLTDLLSGKEASAISNALGILGFLGIGGVATIPKVVRAVKGKVDGYRRNDDGSYTYGKGKAAVKVDEDTHRAIQSSAIADLYSSVAIGPIAKFNGKVKQVNIYVLDHSAKDLGASSGSTFTKEDTGPFARYSKSAELLKELESEEDSAVTTGIWLRPVSGSYGGAERGYVFSAGEGATYKNVQIDDDSFRAGLESGTIRFTAGDLLKVNMETTQRTYPKTGRTSVSHRITRVIEYKPMTAPRQATFEELEGEAEDDDSES